MAKVIFDSEKELEDFIFNRIKKTGECPISGDRVDEVWRQVSLGKYGVADIIKATIDYNGTCYLTVLELKKETVGLKTIAQVMRYVAGLKDMVKEGGFFHHVEINAEIAAPQINSSDDAVFVLNEIEGLYAYEVKVTMEDGLCGISDQSDGWAFADGYEKTEFEYDLKQRINDVVSDHYANNTPQPSLLLVKGGKNG